MVFGFGSSNKPPPPSQPVVCTAWPPVDPDPATKPDQGRGQSVRLDPLPSNAYVADPASVPFLGTIDVTAFPVFVPPDLKWLDAWYWAMFNDPTHQLFLDAKMEDARNLIRLAWYVYTQHELEASNLYNYTHSVELTRTDPGARGVNFFTLRQRTVQLLYCVLNQLRHLKKDIEQYIPADESLDTPAVQAAIQLVTSYAQALHLSINQKFILYARTNIVPEVQAYCDVARTPTATVLDDWNNYTTQMARNPARVDFFCGSGINTYITPSQAAPHKGMVPALNPKLCYTSAVNYLPAFMGDFVGSQKYTQRMKEFYIQVNVLFDQYQDPEVMSKRLTQAEADRQIRMYVYPFLSFYGPRVIPSRYSQDPYIGSNAQLYRPQCVVPSNTRTVMAFAQTRYLLARRQKRLEFSATASDERGKETSMDYVQINYIAELCPGMEVVVLPAKPVKSKKGDELPFYPPALVTRTVSEQPNPKKPAVEYVYVQHLSDLTEAKYPVERIGYVSVRPSNGIKTMIAETKKYNQMLKARDLSIMFRDGEVVKKQRYGYTEEGFEEEGKREIKSKKLFLNKQETEQYLAKRRENLWKTYDNRLIELFIIDGLPSDKNNNQWHLEKYYSYNGSFGADQCPKTPFPYVGPDNIRTMMRPYDVNVPAPDLIKTPISVSVALPLRDQYKKGYGGIVFNPPWAPYWAQQSTPVSGGASAIPFLRGGASTLGYALRGGIATLFGARRLND